MNISTLLGAIAIVALGALQYTLMVNGIRDLYRRPRVRGGNKVLWALTILCLPIAGALIHGWMGPTSFLSRQQIDRAAERRKQSPPETTTNVTPISHARSARVTQRNRPASTPPTRIRKTGS